ncbi:hypothetical protein AR1Y2_1016 [Anaerostipes rhamnosivorans]|uniref:Uncharacterized protein n=1 Tax=Anaerostipes rhamnosivorans TaxID=1229621 RepID=A0A4V1EG12_9FIRM|nr:hypothetical protein AR1Y2_1016 [Anaerostipes rhamnosivorans]
MYPPSFINSSLGYCILIYKPCQEMGITYSVEKVVKKDKG